MKTPTIAALISFVMTVSTVAAISTANAQRYEIKPNIFTGGQTLYSGGRAILDVTPNIFSGGSTIKYR